MEPKRLARTWTWLGVLLLVFTRLVDGYGYLSFPPAAYRDMTRSQIYTAEVNTSIHPTFFVFRFLLHHRAASFVDGLAFADYKSLREFADEAFPSCGNSMVDDDIEPVNVYNATHLEWRNEDEKFGFYLDGEGPCETWIDDERVQFRADCTTTYKNYPATIPIDYSRCAIGRVCELRFYWFATNLNPFRLMKHCVRIVNDPNLPLAEANKDPYKNRTAVIQRNDSFSLDVTMTWEKIWLDDGEDIGSFATILVIP